MRTIILDTDNYTGHLIFNCEGNKTLNIRTIIVTMIKFSLVTPDPPPMFAGRGVEGLQCHLLECHGYGNNNKP